MKTPDEIVCEIWQCTCDQIYKIRGLADPSCVLCEEGGNIAQAIEEYAPLFAFNFAIWKDRNFKNDPHESGKNYLAPSGDRYTLRATLDQYITLRNGT